MSSEIITFTRATINDTEAEFVSPVTSIREPLHHIDSRTLEVVPIEAGPRAYTTVTFRVKIEGNEAFIKAAEDLFHGRLEDVLVLTGEHHMVRATIESINQSGEFYDFDVMPEQP